MRIKKEKFDMNKLDPRAGKLSIQQIYEDDTGIIS